MLRRFRSQTLFHSARTGARTRHKNYAGRRERRANHDSKLARRERYESNGSYRPRKIICNYVTRKNREGTRKVAELPPANPIIHTAVASPHKVAQGKQWKLMDPAPWMRFHPFVATLVQERLASGVSATCGEPWTRTAITTAVDRGPHTSALTPNARELIKGEVLYQTATGFSEVVFWHNLRNKLPVNLKISPLAVIPQVGRRGRLLLDLLFPVQAA